MDLSKSAAMESFPFPAFCSPAAAPQLTCSTFTHPVCNTRDALHRRPCRSSPYLAHPTTQPSTPCRTRRSVITTTASSASPTTHIITIIADDDGNALTDAREIVRENVAQFEGAVSHWRTLSHNVVEAHVCLSPTANYRSLSSTLCKPAARDPTTITSTTTAIEILNADIAVQPIALARTPKKLAVFDLDSTLIQQETIDELAAELNLQPQVAEITSRAMNGTLDFRAALAQRVALLKGLPLNALDAVVKRATFTPGAQQLTQVLRRTGVRTAVVSGGFTFLANHVRDVLGLDVAHANQLEVAGDGTLTGRTVGAVVDAEFKREALRGLAREGGVRYEGVVAVGDGANDLLMIGEAGLGVAFNAKEVVQRKAEFCINRPSLVNVLYLMGYSDEQINALSSS